MNAYFLSLIRIPYWKGRRKKEKREYFDQFDYFKLTASKLCLHMDLSTFFSSLKMCLSF